MNGGEKAKGPIRGRACCKLEKIGDVGRLHMNGSTKGGWQKFLRIWNAIRQILSVRSLLQWLGLWKYLTAVGTTVISFGLGAWAYFRGLSGPNIALVVIGSFCLITVIGSAILHAVRPPIPAGQDNAPLTLKQRTMQLANELFAFLDKQGPQPRNPLSYKGSDEAEQKRIWDAYFDWKKSAYFNYMAYFKDRVVKIDYELAAVGIFTKLEHREIDPPPTSHEVDLKKIAEALLLTATQMSEVMKKSSSVQQFGHQLPQAQIDAQQPRTRDVGWFSLQASEQVHAWIPLELFIRSCSARFVRNVRFDPLESRHGMKVWIDPIASLAQGERVRLGFHFGQNGEYIGVANHFINFFEGGSKETDQPSYQLTIRFLDGVDERTEQHTVEGHPLSKGGISLKIYPTI